MRSFNISSLYFFVHVVVDLLVNEVTVPINTTISMICLESRLCYTLLNTPQARMDIQLYRMSSQPVWVGAIPVSHMNVH